MAPFHNFEVKGAYSAYSNSILFGSKIYVFRVKALNFTLSQLGRSQTRFYFRVYGRGFFLLPSKDNARIAG